MLCWAEHGVRLSWYPMWNPPRCSQNGGSSLPRLVRQWMVWSWQCAGICHANVQWLWHPAAAMPCSWYVAMRDNGSSSFCLYHFLLGHFRSEQSVAAPRELSCFVCDSSKCTPWVIFASVTSNKAFFVFLSSLIVSLSPFSSIPDVSLGLSPFILCHLFFQFSSCLCQSLVLLIEFPKKNKETLVSEESVKCVCWCDQPLCLVRIWTFFFPSLFSTACVHLDLSPSMMCPFLCPCLSFL